MSWGGVPLNTRTAAMMDEAQAIYGATITATQGSPNIGVGASAGTHDGEGVIDVSGADLDAIVAAMRQVGFAAWHRTAAEGFSPHVHGVAVGEPGLSSAAADQVTDYLEGRNGLATNAPDDGPRDWVGRTWEDYLAGNPAPGGTPVFRGLQVGFDDVIVTAGSLDPYADVFNGIDNRDDATTVTLHAGDEFYLYASPADTADTDVYSLLNWRLNASGHGTLVLADSFDPDYSYTPPFTWASLGSVAVDTDTLTLTATEASPATPAQIRGDTGAILLRVTCTVGTVTLDWACLQVEPPAGLLYISGTHWSQWFTPALVAHSPESSTTTQRHVHVESVGVWPSEDDRQDAVNAAVAQSVTDYGAAGDTTFSPVPITPSASPYQISAGAGTQVQEQPHDLLGNQEVEVELDRDDMSADWGTWPDYRVQPIELNNLTDGREVSLDPVTSLPVYEFAEGETTSERWTPTSIEFEYLGDERNDGTSGSANSLVTLDQSAPHLTATVAWAPSPAGLSASLTVTCGYLFGDVGFDPPLETGVASSWTESDEVIGRVWVAFAFMSIDLRMPDWRYLVNEWSRSPDALDTSDPEGVVETIVTWLRQRQRNDGLGNSVIRARGSSSRQMSLRQRGYR